MDEWGLSGGIAWSQTGTGQGLSLSFNPHWGSTATNRQQLWHGSTAGYGRGAGYGSAHNGGYGAGTGYGAGYGTSAGTAHGTNAGYAYGLGYGSNYGPGTTSADQPGSHYSLELNYGILVFRDELLNLHFRNTTHAGGKDSAIGLHLTRGYFSTGYEALKLPDSTIEHQGFVRYHRDF